MIYRATVSESFWQLEMIQTALNIKDKQIENLRKYIDSDYLHLRRVLKLLLRKLKEVELP